MSWSRTPPRRGTHPEGRDGSDGLRGFQEFPVGSRPLRERQGLGQRVEYPGWDTFVRDRGELRARDLGMLAVAGQRGPRNPDELGH
jgi:hypothetical protein